MLSTRGLRPANYAPSIARSVSARSNVARKFSSLPRKPLNPAPSSRTVTLHSARWRAGATSSPNVLLNASAVRHGSWYAPWTWSIPPPADARLPSTPSEFAAEAQPPPEPVVTTQTPELSPETLDHPAVVDGTVATQAHESVEELLADQDPATAVQIVDPTTIPEHIGFLKELGLDYGWGTTATFEYMIEHIHIWGGLGWGSSIVAACLIIRVIGFPFQVKGSNNMAKMQALAPVTSPLHEELKQAMAAKDSDKVLAVRARMRAIYKSANCGPFKGMVPGIIQGVLGFGAFRCIRGMASLPVTSMQSEGFLWFQDLTVADPYYILPAAVGGFAYFFMKAGGETGVTKDENPTTAGVMQTMGLILPLLFTTMAVWMPAGLQLYFVMSTIIGMVTAKVLRVPSVRNLFRLHPIPSPQNKQLWSSVAQGKVDVNTVRDKQGNYKWQPANQPRTITAGAKVTPDGRATYRGMTLKQGAVLPTHIAASSGPQGVATKYGDFDYDAGMKSAMGLMGKASWAARNYKPGMMYWRTLRFMSLKFLGGSLDELVDQRTKAQKEKEARRRRAK
ncbi:60Kd inner membrane protein-domain-containing protein [Lophiotrema nucula]|uniref:60Kd inner membrane protein-domain-containing protein n=1 Tax=Lophiotrema nucula TaxID=690887 RepID=A0A6A5Z466_9PLEO|nr:60Kd inner membrane protein-domain-containing protein [Lophiotrema nucula]